MNIYKKIRAIRIAKKISKAEMARRLGVTRQCYGQLENGDYEPQIARLSKIAKALDVQVTDFFVLKKAKNK